MFPTLMEMKFGAVVTVPGFSIYPLCTTKTKVASLVGHRVALLVKLKFVSAAAQKLLEKVGWVCKCIVM